MIYTITDEQIKQFNADRFDDKCSNCAFHHKPECNKGDCVEGCLRYNITPLNQENFPNMSTEILRSLVDVLQSEIKNREENEREIEDLMQRYEELSRETEELGIELC